MFSRVNNAEERELILADGSRTGRRGANCCNKFWISSEFAYNFLNVLLLSTYALATQITDIAKMPSDYETIELANTAIYISIPFAVLFAASEAACHYAESTLISSHANADVGNDDLAPAPLRPWQIALTASHLLSDVYTDVGGYLAIAEIAGLKQQTDALRYGLYAGLTMFSVWGNVQEARNATESFRDMNATARRMNASSV